MMHLPQSTKRIGVLGSGIAGLFTAYELAKNEAFGAHTITVVSENALRHAASATPVALLNPATGRSAKLISGADFLLPFTSERIQEIEAWSGRDVLKQTGVLRPAPDAETAGLMLKRYQTDPWPNGWACWLEKEAINEQFPGVFAEYGGLWIQKGASVDMPALLKSLREWLGEAGVELLDTFVKAIQVHPTSGNSGKIRMHTDGYPDVLDFDRLVVATGHKTRYLQLLEAGTEGADAEAPQDIAVREAEPATRDLWPDGLSLHRVKGQMLRVKFRNPPDLECAISMRGYVAPTSTTGEWGVGSTYEHEFEHEKPDIKARLKLLEILGRILPGYEREVESVRGWAGIRTHRPPLREPLLEAHPSVSGLFALTGFGSKGLILGPYMARNLVSRLARNGFP